MLDLTSSPLLTVPETAVILRVHSHTVRALIAQGKIPIVKLGRLIFIRKIAVENFLEAAEHRERSWAQSGHTLPQTYRNKR